MGKGTVWERNGNGMGTLTERSIMEREWSGTGTVINGNGQERERHGTCQERERS